MARLARRRITPFSHLRPASDSSAENDALNGVHGVSSPTSSGVARSSAHPPSILSRHTLMVLVCGMLIGYLLLPMVLVGQLGYDPAVEMYGRGSSQSDAAKVAAQYAVPILNEPSPLQDLRGSGDYQFSDSEHSRRMEEAGDDDETAKDDEAADTQARAAEAVNEAKQGSEAKPADENGSKREKSSKKKDTLSTDNLPAVYGDHLTEEEKRFVAQYELLSRQSVPTWTSPFTFETKKLADSQRKKILVTGGAGFVGSHLVDKLMGQGHEVIVLDNFFTGQKKNVEHWLHHPLFSLVVHDVTEPIMLEVDQIYHLACPASPPHYQYNPVKTIKTSTMGTINMLGLAKRVRARMLLTSTSEIYGDPEVHPQPESYWGNVNTIGPRSCYDEGKRVAETMMYSYHQQNNVEVRVARIFNTFGPRMHPNDGRVVSNFIIQALQNKPITIYGDGEQTRSFQYVSDLVEGLHALMNGDYIWPVNLGNPDEYSVKRFAEYIKKMTNSESEITYLPKSQDDPTQRRPDISTAKKELGWAPKTTVEDGLKNAIDYFQRVLDEAGEIIPTGPGAAKPEA